MCGTDESGTDESTNRTGGAIDFGGEIQRLLDAVRVDAVVDFGAGVVFAVEPTTTIARAAAGLTFGAAVAGRQWLGGGVRQASSLPSRSGLHSSQQHFAPVEHATPVGRHVLAAQ